MNQRTDGLAIASLTLSIMSFCLGPFGFIPGIICGHMSRSRIRRDPTLSGDGIAVAGLIVGYVCLVFAIVVMILFLSIAKQPIPDFEKSDALPTPVSYQSPK